MREPNARKGENMAKHRFILEIDLDEANEKECQEFDKEQGEGACMRDFTSSIEDYVADILPLGIDIKILQE
jgi:hypothetical protein